jgi:hypothetical protein
VNEHPWATEVGIVLNFDARGNSGPSIMFETSDGNGWLINQYAQAALQPLATSLSMDVYKIMPNYSDLTVFKKAGMGGLNFAFGSGLAYYHTPEDTPENLDQRTLQHQGENALATARHFGRLDLDNPRADDVIYTSVLNRIVVSYPKSWIVPLALLAVGVYVAAGSIGIRNGEMRFADSLAGSGAFLCVVIVSLLAIGILFLLGLCCSLLRDISGAPPIPWLKYDVLIMTGCALLASGIAVAIARFAANSRPLRALILGAFSWWLGLALATAFWLPGASYLFVWPTLGGLLGLVISSRLAPGSPMACAANFLGSLPSLLLLAPLIRTTFDGLSLPMTAPIIVLVVLFMGTLMPLWAPLVLRPSEPEHAHKRERSAQRELEVERVS